jgi:hypothetical protein
MADRVDDGKPASQDRAEIDNTAPAPEKESIGYGRPPKRTRWKKGQSGNSKGRPKGSKNLSTLLEEEMNQTVAVTENGVRKRISKKQAIAKRVVNGAISGETKMVPLLLGQGGLKGDAQARGAAADVPLAAEDELVFRNFLRRLREAEPITDPAPFSTRSILKPISLRHPSLSRSRRS